MSQLNISLTFAPVDDDRLRAEDPAGDPHVLALHDRAPWQLSDAGPALHPHQARVDRRPDAVGRRAGVHSAVQDGLDGHVDVAHHLRLVEDDVVAPLQESASVGRSSRPARRANEIYPRY